MEPKLKVAVIQMDAVPHPVPKRLSRAAGLIAEAVNDQAQLVVLPEMFNTGYEFHQRNYALAEPMDGQTVTWMKTQAAQHNIHLAGSLLLLDRQDIYNAALLVAPDARTWRYDKINITFWERAYSREGSGTTIADTDLGKLGMMVCSDVLCPDLWVEYAGKVDAIVVMFSPGDTSQAELVFPDGFRIEYAEFEQAVSPPGLDSYPGFDVMQQHITWMSVPMLFAGGTGMVSTGLPGLDALLAGSTMSDRVGQASEARLELSFGMATMIGEPKTGIRAQGTTTGDGVILAEIELANLTPQPKDHNPTFHPSIPTPSTITSHDSCYPPTGTEYAVYGAHIWFQMKGDAQSKMTQQFFLIFVFPLCL